MIFLLVAEDLALATFSALLSVDIAEKRASEKIGKKKTKSGGFFMKKTTILVATVVLILGGENAKARQLV
ncbi:hypothetical protein CBW65_23710 [Tumebacillus avium]|uniref:Uncharacterized protein n=1 Tax=Tumebacillus avium TaxID=1903704 RepID=A0A1Y0ISS7_9BACL|nr:hypothetical protein [Tumebacillus avium]ARU63692.1 hypothetical protein CBW65_23710 [Tumebacillus avium]